MHAFHGDRSVEDGRGGYARSKEQAAFTAFERLFKERGLPHAIRSDNGIPFASPNGLFNLSRLSVWWLRLGIIFRSMFCCSPIPDRSPKDTACFGQ
jgi:hypothetical protein